MTTRKKSELWVGKRQGKKFKSSLYVAGGHHGVGEDYIIEHGPKMLENTDILSASSKQKYA